MSTPIVAPRHSHRPGTARAALSYPDFRWIWLALFASNIGTWMQNFTLPAYIDDRTHSAALVGVLVFTQLGPLLLLSIPAGVIAEKVPRRAFLVTVQSIQMVFSVVLAALIATDSPLWTLFGAQLAIGVGNAMNAPALQGSMPSMVARQDLSGAVALNSVSINASRVIGPALAALLSVVGVTTAQVFLINAVTYLFLITALLLVNVPDIRGQHREVGWRRLLTGINIVRRRQVLARCLSTMFLFSLLSLPYIGLFPSVARLNFGIDATSATYKWLYTTWGLGACIGALSVATVLHHVDKRRLVLTGLIGFAGSLTLFAVLRSVGPAIPTSFVLGAFYFMLTTALMTIVQENLLDTERTPVMPLWFMAFGGTIPIGNLIFGPVMDAIGARVVLVFGAVVAVLLARACDLRRFGPDAFLSTSDPPEPPDSRDIADRSDPQSSPAAGGAAAAEAEGVAAGD